MGRKAGRTKSGGRAWRKRAGNPTTDPGAVFKQHAARELSDVERCRLAWERCGDPLAIVVAITQADIPEWLIDGVLFLLTEESEGSRPTALRKLWRGRRRDAIDMYRAACIAGLRLDQRQPPYTWDRAYEDGDRLARLYFPTIPTVSPGAMKKAYARVAGRLKNPGRYYRAPSGFSERHLEALERLRVIVDAAVKREKAGE
jgi:hypothetical protein